MSTIRVELPVHLVARATAAARRQRISRSVFICRALKAYLSTEPTRPSGHAIDLVRDLAGSVRSGPRDISTNPKYLEGFGR